MMKYKVLAADDEVELVDVLRLYFEKEEMEFLQAKDGKEALCMFKQYHPHIVLLDIMMPELDGFEVLKRIRRESHIPAIMVTARIQDYDKILGLELGADDYVTKPYNPLEVVARVKALLRRSYDYQGSILQNVDGVIQPPVLEKPDFNNSNAAVDSKYSNESITIGDVSLNVDEGMVVSYGKASVLTAIEYHILKLFMQNPGRIFTKNQIFRQVWKEEYLGDDNTIMVHISNLRKKIEQEPTRPKYIKTVKGLGYKFEKRTTNE